MTDQTKPEPESKASETRPAETPGKEKATDKKKPAHKPRRHKTGAGNTIAMLALLGVLLLAGGLFYLWDDNKNTLEKLQHQLEQQHSRLTARLEQQAQTDDNIKSELQALEERQQTLNDALAKLLKANRHLRHEWLQAEAEYLVRLASQRLVLARDTATAISALQAADARLREAGDPALIPLRKALAEDINTLQAIRQIDITGLSLKLSALVADIDNLRLLTPQPETPPQTDAQKKRHKVENWKQLPAAMWEDIKSLIIIRDRQGPITPLLAPKQLFFLRQNLKLQLEQARLALLNGENEVYHERLDTARKWIENWFDPVDNRTLHVLKSLEDLAAVNIHPQLPALSRTYQAFEAFHENQATSETPAAAPPVTEAPQVTQ